MSTLREFKFCCLSEDNKLLVTKWLTDEDKMKLVEAFPPIVPQITTFKFLTEPEAEDEVQQLVELFKKLNHVKKVSLPLDVTEGLQAVILSGQHNQGIEKVVFDSFGIALEYDDYYLDYIENVIKLGGTSKVKKTFDILNEKACKLIEKYPELLLNLHLDVATAINFKTNVHILNMIEYLRTDGGFMTYVDGLDIVFNSVKVVELFETTNIIPDLRNLSKRTPNVSELKIRLNSLKDVNADYFIAGVFKCQHLDTLDITSYEEEDETFMKIVNTLITTTAKSKLVNLSIRSYCKKFKLEEIFKSAIRIRKFKSLKLVEDPYRGVVEIIKKKTLKLKDVDHIPLINIINKFNNKIKVVIIKTENDEYFKKCQEDIKNFRFMVVQQTVIE